MYALQPANDSWTAFITIYNKFQWKMNEIAGMAVRDGNDEKAIFSSVDQAFEEAQKFIEGFRKLPD